VCVCHREGERTYRLVKGQEMRLRPHSGRQHLQRRTLCQRHEALWLETLCGGSDSVHSLSLWFGTLQITYNRPDPRQRIRWSREQTLYTPGFCAVKLIQGAVGLGAPAASAARPRVGGSSDRRCRPADQSLLGEGCIPCGWLGGGCSAAHAQYKHQPSAFPQNTEHRVRSTSHYQLSA
jgi:hypothetical protein